MSEENTVIKCSNHKLAKYAEMNGVKHVSFYFNIDGDCVWVFENDKKFKNLLKKWARFGPFPTS